MPYEWFAKVSQETKLGSFNSSFDSLLFLGTSCSFITRTVYKMQLRFFCERGRVLIARGVQGERLWWFWPFGDSSFAYSHYSVRYDV
jgi:hypothetical protein